MIAGMALRHIYSMASWSPSQSDPLTVSYMCQRQSSGTHIAERGADAALRRHGMAARRKDLGDAGRLEPGGGHAQGRAQPGAAGADDDDVVAVVDDLVCLRHGGQPLTATRSTAKTPATASRTQAKRRCDRARRA